MHSKICTLKDEVSMSALRRFERQRRVLEFLAFAAFTSIFFRYIKIKQWEGKKELYWQWHFASGYERIAHMKTKELVFIVEQHAGNLYNKSSYALLPSVQPSPLIYNG